MKEKNRKKERAAGYQSAHSFTGSSFHLAPYSTYAYYSMQGWNWRIKTLQQMRGSLGDLKKGWICVCATLMDPISCVYLLKKVPSRDVCKGHLVSEHSINASQLLYNSVYLSVTVLSSIYQRVRLSCTLYMFPIAGVNGLPQRYLNSFQKMHKETLWQIYLMPSILTGFYVSLPFMCPFERCNWTSKQGDILNTWSAVVRHSTACESTCHSVILNQTDLFICLNRVKAWFTL